jgi:small-conductance mechanosensitive channel
VTVAYDSDPDLVEKLLLEVADKEPGVLKSPVPKVRLTGFGESGLDFSLMVWTHDYTDFQGSLKSLLNFSILRTFKTSGVQIPYPRRDIRIINQASEEKDSV